LYYHFLLHHWRLLRLPLPHQCMTKNDVPNSQHRRSPPMLSRRMSYECNQLHVVTLYRDRFFL
jgi:hypothetical protein